MKIAVLFPGYGSQFLGMGKALYDDERLVQEYFEEASACLNINFVKLCFASSEAELAKMNNAYLANLVLGYSIFALLKAEEIKPDVITGENIGAFTALTCAGAMNFPDALYLLNKYATVYQEFLDTHNMSMLSIFGLDEYKVIDLCKKASSDEHQVYVSVVRSMTHIMVGGHTSAVERLKELLDLTYDVTYKDESCANELHSVLMAPVVESLKPYLVKVDIKNLTQPVTRSIDGKNVSEIEEVVQTMVARITRTIYPALLFEQMSAYDLIIQIGPGKDIAQLLQKKFPHKAIMDINQRSDLNEVKKYLQSQIQVEK